MAKEKKWSAIVIVRGHGEIEYTFECLSFSDAMSYLEDNVMDDYGQKLYMQNIKSLEEVE